MNRSSISKLKWLRESMLRVVVACMFSLWEALEDGLEVCITTMRTRLTGFFWHCFDADATLSVIGGIKFIQYIVKLGDQSFSFSYLSRFFYTFYHRRKEAYQNYSIKLPFQQPKPNQTKLLLILLDSRTPSM